MVKGLLLVVSRVQLPPISALSQIPRSQDCKYGARGQGETDPALMSAEMKSLEDLVSPATARRINTESRQCGDNLVAAVAGISCRD